MFPVLFAALAALPAPSVLFNGWGLSPAGDPQIPASNLVLKMEVAPDRRALVAVSGGFTGTGVTIIDLASHAATQFVPLEHCWNGIAFNRRGDRLFVTGANEGSIHVFRYEAGRIAAEPDISPRKAAGPVFLTGIAVQPATGEVYVCNEAASEVWVLDGTTLAWKTSVPVGAYPHSCLFGGDRVHLYVSDWGASSVSIVDSRTRRWVRDLAVGLRPNDLALAPDGRLFVACSGDNTVHVIPTARLEKVPAQATEMRPLWGGAREVISTSLYPESPEGSTPDAVAVAPDGKTLFVANADNNDVAVVDISGKTQDADGDDDEDVPGGPPVSVVDGFIPVGWYPSALAVSPDGNTLFAANGKGLGSRANYPAQGAHPRKLFRPPPFDAIGGTLGGTVACIARPTTQQMAHYTEQVRRNSPYQPKWMREAPVPQGSVIPAKVGDPCAIRYVLYVIRENRTYDQVLGDLKDAAGRPLGNGDPRLAMYGERVTPNAHAFARSFVDFDNLYCNSEVSVDGHSWCDAAIATDYNERSWIASYSHHGNLPGNDQMEDPAAGFIWNDCLRAGLSFRSYGEGSQRVPSADRGRWGGGFKIRDYRKVDWWIDDLQHAERGGDLPRFTIMSLGEDHTQATQAGAHTPDSDVASNDWGLGKIVEAASHSRFWRQMAIFVIEDDAQNGPDHVDAHRTEGFVLSPYCRRSSVDHTPYTTASMVRTMELILGLPPMTQYDAAATPMYRAFSLRPDLTPYTAIKPAVDLEARNTREAAGARESARMDLAEYDRAPEDALNRILWAYSMGGTPYPTPIHRAIFVR